MNHKFIKKEGIAQSFLARYLLTEQPGNRLKTIDALAKESDLSVGLMQGALKSLEQAGAIGIERRGRNGSFIVTADQKALLKHANIGNVVCAMPLPYTRIYEGLASGLKAQFADISFYFAHMRGSDVRIECLLNSLYDLAVTSRLAAESYVKRQQVQVALSLGEHSYTEQHQLIYRRGERDTIRNVGIDSTSADQKIMTAAFFAGQGITLVEISYHECLKQIVSGDIDAVIWNVGHDDDLTTLGLVTESLSGDECFTSASEAVILTRPNDVQMQQLLHTLVDRHRLLQHQQHVVAGEIRPVY
ncbi:hypothetical protein C9426_33910 [Serratia sp. S1B]|nr:hypothetical protein C9426_33910 [Serratia sp. S1B]